jgi:hypothetical protein
MKSDRGAVHGSRAVTRAGELKDSEAGAPRAPVGENTDLSLINCDSASLAIARRNFSIFVRISSVHRAGGRRKARPGPLI